MLFLVLGFHATCLVSAVEFFKQLNSEFSSALWNGGRDAEYGYDGGQGVKSWNGTCRTGQAQSPVDFKTVELVISKPLQFHGIDQKPISTLIENTGHSVQVTLKTHQPITVTGGLLHADKYKFLQFHFHWGKDSHDGSEHTIASRRYPLECHLVFRKLEKSSEPHFAVIAVLYKLKRSRNSFLDSITKNVHRVTKAYSKYRMKGGHPLEKFLPEQDHRDIYHFYHGSLTTPPCSQVVKWIVFSSTKTASESQIATFRNIMDDNGYRIAYNFRPTKPLNGRHVYLTE